MGGEGKEGQREGGREGQLRGNGWEGRDRVTAKVTALIISHAHTSESEGSSGSSTVEIISMSGSTPRDSPDVTPSLPSTATPTPPPSVLGVMTSSSDDDSLLTVRAKLFYKKGSEFTDLGVGNLKVQSSSKGAVQLLMRNDTSLGTILLNVKVTGDIPVSCSSKSVLIVCPAANPSLSVGEGPVTYLLRVKTAELAEQLLKAIQDNTKT